MFALVSRIQPTQMFHHTQIVFQTAPLKETAQHHLEMSSQSEPPFLIPAVLALARSHLDAQPHQLFVFLCHLPKFLMNNIVELPTFHQLHQNANSEASFTPMALHLLILQNATTALAIPLVEFLATPFKTAPALHNSIAQLEQMFMPSEILFL